MKWEQWDPDLIEVKDVSGGCVDGTTCVFAMKNGSDVPITLCDVVENESLTFKGSAAGGMLSCVGTIKISKVDNKTSKIDYTFEISGCVGFLLSTFNNKVVVEGTEHGLENIVKLSEEAQKTKKNFLGF